MARESISSVLSKYLPPKAVEICTSWIIQKNIHLKLTRGRATKYGDYMPLPPGQGHRITINHDLNPYSFLITFIHEVAHLEAFNKYSHHEPHGKEWKSEYKFLMSDFIHSGIFPDDIRQALSQYMANPAASSCTDYNLMKTLRKYDINSGTVNHLEDLPEGTEFILHQSNAGMVFKKGHLIRKRFHCTVVGSGKIYYVSPLAEVEEVSVKSAVTAG